MPGALEGARSTVQRTRPPRIALLCAYLSDDYEWTIWRSLRETVEARGGSAVCVAGAGIHDPVPERRARSSLHELVAPGAFDGVVCVSSVTGHFAGIKATEAWLAERGLPAICVGPAERVASVVVDDATGMTQLLHHLIDHHGHRRIAFIRGGATNIEAESRLSAYERALQSHDLASDRRLILEGDFTPASGARAVVELFDRRQVRAGDVDAIVASNDYMAFGAIEELSRRRISVPGELAVVGFDDIAPARVHHPSLTTVRQPLERLGREAAERLLAVLGGHAVEQSIMLETELVLRRSCGCVPTDLPDPGELGAELEDVTIPGRAQLGSQMEAALAGELFGTSGAFARALEPYLRQAAAGDATRLERGRRFAEELALRVRAAHQDLVHERLNALSRILHARAFGPQAHLSTTLAELLPDLGIDECVISELVRTEPGPAGRQLKVALGFDAGTLQPQLASFEAHEFVPSRFEHLRAHSAVALPITTGAELTGVAVFAASARDGAFYETLAEIAGSVLRVLELRRKAGV
jgi:DNA-binding LacI/PurR family transcriptional regulator